MKVRKGPARAALLSTLVSAALTIVAVAPASAATTPPYEPDSGSAGSISFYDATGTVLTSGPATTRIGYAVGSAALTSTGSKASLYGYLPQSGKAPGAFSGELLAGPTVYPVSGAPGGSTNPTVVPAGSDLTFADLAKDFPNTATDAYANLYQIRIKTSDTKYLSTDISISNGTWSQVYPSVAVGTTTTLSVAPTSTGQTLTAAVTPSGATGSVQFLDGGAAIGSPVAVSSDAASLATDLAPGSHNLTATFTPDDQVNLSNSTSPVVTYAVSGSVTINGSTNQFVTFQQRVIIAGKAPAGRTVTVYFHRVNVAGLTSKTFPADANGNWGTKYDATDDYTYYAVVGSLKSVTVNSRMDPGLSAKSQTVRKGTKVTLSGRGGNKTRVTVHLGGATATVVTAAGGTWSYIYTVTRTTKVYVNRPDHVIASPGITLTAF